MEFVTMALGSLARRPTVLIVLHQEHSTPGRIGLALKAMGVRLDIRRPSCGEPLPGALAENKPLLGLCLGAQMLARALGARVFGYDDKRSEIGYYPLEPTPSGDRL